MAQAFVADPRVGDVLAGYRIERVLGRGGMGVVFLAGDPWLERRVALKLIAPELAEDQGFRERFLRESRLAASLEHASVIPIYEAGEADGLLYLAMRYVDGSDLGSLLAEEGRLEPSRAVEILERVAVALDAAHAKELVHRDVKPGNVLISSAGDVYLSDFGLTRHRDESGALTETGQVVGTLDYLAPEQIESREVSAETDVYALACVLFECLAGGVPFEGDSKFGVMFAHLQGERPSVSERVEGLPPAIDAALARGMALSPEERYSSCGELIAEARLVLLGDGQAGSGVEQARAPIRAVAARNPYKGLRAFGEAGADDFFGREALAGELRARLAQGARLTAVVGPSGSGKSSVVSSGLLPLVRGGSIPGSERWRIVEVLPGAHPFEELEAALLELAPGRSAEVLVALREGGGGLVKAAARLLGGDPDAELLVVCRPRRGC